MRVTVEGSIRHLGSTYADGTPRLEIHIPIDRAHGLPFEMGKRIPITVRIDAVEYQAGLRATSPSKLVWISPDMRTSTGEPTTLGRILIEAGFATNDRVSLISDNQLITVRRIDSAGHFSSSRQGRAAGPKLSTGYTSSHTSVTTRDPLKDFDWSRLYERYDAMCRGFQSDSQHLAGLASPPHSDRDLYRQLVASLRSGDGRRSITAQQYQAMLYWKLYWKLYSQPAAVANIAAWFESDTKRAHLSERLQVLLAGLPALSRDWSEISDALSHFRVAAVSGMKSSEALPVRTTFLHFLFPDVIPVFDMMVLQAVGMWSKGANTRMDVLRGYLPVAWGLARAYESQLHAFEETPVRVIDMALWVTRNATV